MRIYVQEHGWFQSFGKSGRGWVNIQSLTVTALKAAKRAKSRVYLTPKSK